MTLTARLLAAAMLVGAGLLAGCVETRFEAPLGDNIETCDTHWKGLWTEDAAEHSSPSGFFVDEECRFIVLDQPEKGGPLKQLHVPMNYVHANGQDYLVVADVALKGLVELNPVHGIKPPPEKAFFYTRYRMRGDRLDLYQVATERVAKLVIDGKLEGTVSKTANELHVFVRGDRTRMLEIVRTLPIFADKPEVTLVRRHQSLAEFEKAVIEAQRKPKK